MSSTIKGPRGKAPEIEVATGDAPMSNEELERRTAPNAAPVEDAGATELFTGFEDDKRTPHDNVEIDVDVQAQIDDDMRMVPIVPRETLMRTRIGNKDDGSPAWYNFIKDKEVFVPNHVAKWLREQGVV